MHGAQELPLTGPHLWASCCRTRRIVKQEADDKIIAFVYKKAAEFIEPEGTVDAFWLCGDEDCRLACDRNNVLAIGGLGVVVVEGFEMFLQLKGGVEL
jgi:hypothetical protein